MQFLRPNWQAPTNVKAFSTMRQGGFSQAPFTSFNLGDHVGDEKNSVKNNRTLLVQELQLPQAPLYLQQTHSTRALRLPYAGENLNADASYSQQAKQVCLVMTADCLPVLFCNRQGTEVAAAHAGWRGLCDGVLEETVAQFDCAPADILAWFAPAIGAQAFQVGAEVLAQFVAKNAEAEQAFRPDPKQKDKYFADLYLLARQRLEAQGIQQISGGEYCTFSDPERFFSYRREGKTGRMASLIWFE